MSVYIVSHKEFNPPLAIPDNYKTIYVGPNSAYLAKKFEGLSDVEGDSIAYLNNKFCELTAMYWIWKNAKTKYKGIVHYRRFFINSSGDKAAISEEQIFNRLQASDFIVPEKYWLLDEAGRHYSSHHSASDLDNARESIGQLYPEYLDTFDNCMRQKYVYPYNMLIAPANRFDSYCEWLFPILFETNSRIDYSGRDIYQTRAVGFLSERLFAVYLSKHQYKLCETSVLTTEKDIKRTVTMSLAKLLYGRAR